jgi:hypothetical protein
MNAALWSAGITYSGYIARYGSASTAKLAKKFFMSG